MRVDRIVKAVVTALEDVKGRDIVVFNVTKLTAMFDRVIIATGDSNRQVRALADNVRDRLRDAGVRARGVEGAETGEWVLVDLGSVVVHVMQPAIRQHYNLEELWNPPKAPRKRAARKAPAET